MSSKLNFKLFYIVNSYKYWRNETVTTLLLSSSFSSNFDLAVVIKNNLKSYSMFQFLKPDRCQVIKREILFNIFLRFFIYL